MKKRIMLFTDWFDPAYKAGGPIRSSVNFVKQMQDDCEIFVFTGDRDLNESTPLEGIVTDKWVNYSSSVKVYYASRPNLSLNAIRNHIDAIRPDVIYLNSMFSKTFAIYPLWLMRRNKINSKIILAPRGMLKRSALNFKRRKKKLFLSLLKAMKIPKLITFHATNEEERSEIIREFGDVRAEAIANFPGVQESLIMPATKVEGSLNIIFIGRIHPIKGLDVLLKSLKNTAEDIRLTIAGNQEDFTYLSLCKQLARELPGNVKVKFLKEVPHHHVTRMIQEHHVFCLPTRGENFGHAIFEALSVGRPVLISDQTPWRNLQAKKAGWDLPLNHSEQFTRVIRDCAAMDADSFNTWCRGAWDYCKRYIESTNIKEQYLKLFS